MAKQTIDEVMEDYKDCQRCEDKSCLGMVSNCPKDGSIVTREAELMRAVLKITNLDRLEEICTAEKDGRCVVLPCKVGDTIYRVAYDCAGGIKYNPFNEHGVSYAEPCLKCNTYPCDIHKAIYEIKAVSSIWIMENAKNGNFGTKYFLTHEEAEAALAKEGNKL